MRLPCFARFAAFVVVVVGACGGTASPITLESQRLSLAVEDACRATASSVCARVRDCSPGVLTEVFGSIEACEDGVAVQCAITYEGPEAASSVAVCDGATIACDVVKAAFAAPNFLELPSEMLLHQCPVDPGRIVEGGACLTHGDCATGVCARPGGSCGRCVKPLGQDDKCTKSALCEHGLTCRGVCTRLRMPGEECARNGSCAGMSCVANRCVEGGTLSAHCDEEGPLCDRARGFSCDRDLTCKPFSVSANGTACKVHVFDSPDVGEVACPWQLDSAFVPRCTDDSECSSRRCVNGRCGSRCSSNP